MISTWRGPAILAHPAVDSRKGSVGGFAFIAANEDDAIRHATEVYNSSALGQLGIEVSIADDEDEMRRSISDVSAGRSKTIKIYCDRSAPAPAAIP
jgi:hypothetical protein